MVLSKFITMTNFEYMCAKHIIMQTFFRKVCYFFFEIALGCLALYILFLLNKKMDNWSIIEPILLFASFMGVIYFLIRRGVELLSGNSPWRKKKWELDTLRKHKGSNFETIISKLPFLNEYFN